MKYWLVLVNGVNPSSLSSSSSSGNWTTPKPGYTRPQSSWMSPNASNAASAASKSSGDSNGSSALYMPKISSPTTTSSSRMTHHYPHYPLPVSTQLQLPIQRRQRRRQINAHAHHRLTICRRKNHGEMHVRRCSNRAKKVFNRPQR